MRSLKAYRDRRVEEGQRRAATALDTLQNELEVQKDKLEESRVKMLDTMEKFNVVDLSLGSPAWLRGGQPDTGIGRIVMSAKQREFEAEAEIQNLRTTIKALRELSGDELIKAAVNLGVQDPTLTQRYPEYQNLLLAKTQLLEGGLGAKHPKVVSVEKQIEMTQTMLLDAVDTTKKALGTQLAMAEQTYANSKETKERTEKESLRERRQSIDYIEAKKDYELNKEMLNNMQAQLAKERIDSRASQTPIVIHEQAEVPTLPARPNVKLHLVLGLVVGLIFGVGLAFFLEYLDTSVKTLEDVERYLEVPVLAVIPKDVGVLHKQSGLSPDAEAYRILRTNIEFNRKSADANSITVVSGGAGEGKSTTLVNLAYVCAQGGYNTLMIDGDLRRPKLHTFFDINNSVGLTNYLTTDLMLEDVILQTPVENLYFMPSGHLARRRRWHPQLAADVRADRRREEPVRSGAHRLAPDPRGQRRLRARVGGRPHDDRDPAPETATGDAHPREAGDPERGRQPVGCRAEQRRCAFRQPVPVLHQLLHLLLPHQYGSQAQVARAGEPRGQRARPDRTLPGRRWRFLAGRARQRRPLLKDALETTRAMRTIACFILACLAPVAALAQEPILQNGQSFSLRIAGVPQDDQLAVSQAYTISDAGTIKLLYLSEMKASGLRPSQLARKVEAAYRSAQIYSKPNVVITLGEAGGAQRFISVLGELNAQRPVVYTPGLTMLAAVSQCGGFSDFANPKKVKLTRGGKISYHDLSKTSSKDNVILQPDDIVSVPARGLFR